MKASQAQVFEDRRWSSHGQGMVWRHRVALEMVTEDPVLDIGGGDGFFLSLLQQHKGFRRLYLLDISPVAVEKARQKGLDAHVTDITKPLPYPDNYFAAACALDVLEHLYDPLPTLTEMARVARQIVLVVPNFHYWKDRVRMIFGKVPFQCKPARGHVYWFNYAVLQEMISKAGLEVDANDFNGPGRLGKLGKWLACRFPSLFADSFAVRLRKS
ncbi:Methionine biosynthesis MetW [Moorella glycerini]|uniref:Uncharacterized protein n=1 Tax=Neomoorella stamsii TaxID=1266720 RepID=A0A9X7J4Z4_9FIRM|nr:MULTISPECIES: class I SAM-dependent methyltransferase [Moorella]PRR77047.1 hypothetical protein MOST_03430 [Moorella stamsii]CEP68822.1 Methionine biosynthesis MetW [Moorella glycerini]